MIIGITGTLGSGKTTVAKLFSRHSYNRIDADEIAHQTIKKNSPAYKIIVGNFGEEILGKNNDIDRKKLGNIVFNNYKGLQKLNSIMHPTIIENIKNRIEIIKEKCKDKAKIVIDAPLLLETKSKNLVDKIVVVKCNKKNILERLGNKYSKQKIEKILKAQMILKEKLRYADFVMDNNMDLKHLEMQVKKVIKKLN